MEFNPKYWHNIQPPEEMDIERYFEYDEDIVLQIKKWLNLDSSVPKTIVEVGSGSGYFTGKLLKLAVNLEEMITIEPDDILREYLKRKFPTQIRHQKGSVEKIPLPNNFSDLTVSHIVLCNLPDIHTSISEMARITKKGGIVASIEPIGKAVTYFPDPKLNELEEKVDQAFGRGIWELRSKIIDYSRDLKQKAARYPEVFYSYNLTRIEAHGVLSVFLLSDIRRTQEELLAWLRKRLLQHISDWKRKQIILRRGGLSEQVINEFYQAKRSYLQNLIDNPEEIRKTHELNTLSRLITIGIKQ